MMGKGPRDIAGVKGRPPHAATVQRKEPHPAMTAQRLSTLVHEYGVHVSQLYPFTTNLLPMAPQTAMEYLIDQTTHGLSAEEFKRRDNNDPGGGFFGGIKKFFS